MTEAMKVDSQGWQAALEVFDFNLKKHMVEMEKLDQRIAYLTTSDTIESVKLRKQLKSKKKVVKDAFAATNVLRMRHISSVAVPLFVKMMRTSPDLSEPSREGLRLLCDRKNIEALVNRVVSTGSKINSEQCELMVAAILSLLHPDQRFQKVHSKQRKFLLTDSKESDEHNPEIYTIPDLIGQTMIVEVKYQHVNGTTYEKLLHAMAKYDKQIRARKQLVVVLCGPLIEMLRPYLPDTKNYAYKAVYDNLELLGSPRAVRPIDEFLLQLIDQLQSTLS